VEVVFTVPSCRPVVPNNDVPFDNEIEYAMRLPSY